MDTVDTKVPMTDIGLQGKSIKCYIHWIPTVASLSESVITVFYVDEEFRSRPLTDESLKPLVPCVCDRKSFDKLESTERLELIWKKAIEMCQTSSLRSFLRKNGRLSSVSVTQGKNTH